MSDKTFKAALMVPDLKSGKQYSKSYRNLLEMTRRALEENATKLEIEIVPCRELDQLRAENTKMKDALAQIEPLLIDYADSPASEVALHEHDDWVCRTIMVVRKALDDAEKREG